MAARIVGTGSYVPDNIVNNDFLSTIVDTSDEWIYSRTGIKERRVTKGETTADMAIKAAFRAIDNAKVLPEDIDMILVATMTPDQHLPNTACEVQDAVHAVNAFCMDLNAACSGFVYAFNTVHAYMKAGLCSCALIIGTEVISKLIDWEERSTCVLFGDGAGAVVVKNENQGFIGTSVGSDGSKKDSLTCKVRNTNNPFLKEKISYDFIKMDGPEVYKFAVTKVPACIMDVLSRTNTKIDEIRYFILHQANKRIINAVAKRLKVGEDKFPSNLDHYANTSAASIPILLDEMNQQGKLKLGDKIMISGFGGGLTWGATLLTW